MHGMDNFKIIDAQQSKITISFKNAKQKLLKTFAPIRLNKICRINHLTPSVYKLKCKDNKHFVGLINEYTVKYFYLSN